MCRHYYAIRYHKGMALCVDFNIATSSLFTHMHVFYRTDLLLSSGPGAVYAPSSFLLLSQPTRSSFADPRSPARYRQRNQQLDVDKKKVSLRTGIAAAAAVIRGIVINYGFGNRGSSISKESAARSAGSIIDDRAAIQ